MHPSRAPEELASAIYQGETTHVRLAAPLNRFSYGVHMAYIDLHELQAGRLENWPFVTSQGEYALFSFQQHQHMKNEEGDSLLARLCGAVQRETGWRPDGAVRLLTSMSVMGMRFDPVNFYYLFEPHGGELRVVVVEVNNMPWLEQHCYFLTPEQVDECSIPRLSAEATGKCGGDDSGDHCADKQAHIVAESSASNGERGCVNPIGSDATNFFAGYSSAAAKLRSAATNRTRESAALQRPDLKAYNSHAKNFHVSPFIGMDDTTYHWKIAAPDESLRVQIGVQKGASRIFTVALDMRRLPWSNRNLLWIQVRHPLQTIRVILLILCEAGKLYRRGVAFYPHPNGTETAFSRCIARLVSGGYAVISAKETVVAGARRSLLRIWDWVGRASTHDSQLT